MKKRTKKTLGVSIKVFARLLLAVVLCAILHVSMSVIGTGFFSDVVGYQIFEQAEDESVNMIEEHYFEEGEKQVTADDLGLKENQMYTAIRVVPDRTQAVLNVISQIFMLILFAVFPYQILWEFGNRDDTNVRYRGQRPDPWRGVKIGLLASIPFFVVWLLLFAAKFGWIADGYLQVYRLIMFPFMPYVNWIISAAQSFSDIAVWRILLLVLPLLVVPAVSGYAYRLGGRHFSLAEFLTFKKKPDTEDNGEI